MTTYAIAKRPISLTHKRQQSGIRRIFSNDQLIARFEKWLLICGKAESTRINYRDAARQFSKFLVNKPLTAATQDDVRAFIFSLYGRGLAATTMQARLDALRTLFDCLELGGLCMRQSLRKLPPENVAMALRFTSSTSKPRSSLTRKPDDHCQRSQPPRYGDP